MIEVDLPAGARARFTGRPEGDLGHGGVYVTEVAPDVAARRRTVLDLRWTWLRQVHGDTVVRVDGPGEKAGTVADAAVTTEADCALAVLTADCAPVALASPKGVIGVAHAGWAGLAAGILERTVATMRTLGATTVTATLGPCIGPECYEFGAEDLERVVAAVGPEVRTTTRQGRPALDLATGVRAVLGREQVEVDDRSVCTACTLDYFSWRARREQQRQAAVMWR